MGGGLNEWGLAPLCKLWHYKLNKKKNEAKVTITGLLVVQVVGRQHFRKDFVNFAL